MVTGLVSKKQEFWSVVEIIKPNENQCPVGQAGKMKKVQPENN